ncbi:hypothetical protein [uncultured Thermanaerothrix sp.]|uniref:hypothetical protein n=1 Tax=uncultured Thermanaerothrix sp. TaxID=1195149 RepID=UPI00262E0AE8|nr:hypothetical protein [uncultured Thermanaerothrix sp.]
MAVLTQKYRLDSAPVAPRTDAVASPSNPARTSVHLPTLPDVLAGLPFLSHEVALLGVCEDGVPLLLDLRNPSPGALLVISAQPATSIMMLNVIRESLQGANAPFSLQMIRVTDALAVTAHPLERLVNPFERELEQALLSLADLADSRQHGRLRGPSILLVVERLEWILQADQEAIWAFEHLLHYGPALKIWPLVATHPNSETTLTRWLRRFGTLIWGADLSASLKEQFGVPENPLSQHLPHSRCFSLRSQGQWLHLWLPEVA